MAYGRACMRRDVPRGVRRAHGDLMPICCATPHAYSEAAFRCIAVRGTPVPVCEVSGRLPQRRQRGRVNSAREPRPAVGARTDAAAACVPHGRFYGDLSVTQEEIAKMHGSADEMLIEVLRILFAEEVRRACTRGARACACMQV
eukprot:37897-Chlamydomonas_euryale.AAC.4